MSVTVDDVRFIGATLLTDYELYGDPDTAMKAARLGIDDHRLIRVGSRPFMPAGALRMHKQSVAYLESTLAEPSAGETVVVTHHCPHPGSVHQSYAGGRLNPAFCSNHGWLIERYQPTAWIHGHTHSSFDYQVDSTRVVCNPKGYGSENPAFDPHLVVEVGGYNPRPRV